MEDTFKELPQDWHDNNNGKEFNEPLQNAEQNISESISEKYGIALNDLNFDELVL